MIKLEDLFYILGIFLGLFSVALPWCTIIVHVDNDIWIKEDLYLFNDKISLYLVIMIFLLLYLITISANVILRGRNHILPLLGFIFLTISEILFYFVTNTYTINLALELAYSAAEEAGKDSFTIIMLGGGAYLNIISTVISGLGLLLSIKEKENYLVNNDARTAFAE